MEDKTKYIIIIIVAIIAIIGAVLVLTNGGGGIVGGELASHEMLYFGGDKIGESPQSFYQTYINAAYSDEFDNNTMNFINGFDGNQYVVVDGSTEIYIMSITDANKLNDAVKDVPLYKARYVDFKSKIKDTRSLGQNLQNVVVLEDVQNITLRNAS